MKRIDLRSDTVTTPSPAMRLAMAEAEVGDDVYAEDPTVNRLQDLAAEISGKEASLFLPSGTMSNLVALLSHCQRGDEYIVGQQAHTYKYEGGGAAVLGSIQPQPLEFAGDGTLDLAMVEQAIKPENCHFAKTRLLCLENTQAGKVLPLVYQQEAQIFCREHGLSLHLDGARLANAAVAQGVGLAEICAQYDTVSICLSKGLGAPVGSVLVGPREFIEEAHRWRKVCGGGLRQSGVLAAAGIFALTHNLERLADDHARARRLAEGFTFVDGLEVCIEDVQTNMVFVHGASERLTRLQDYLRGNEVLCGGYGSLRLVTHLDVDDADISRVIQLVKDFPG